MSDEFDGAKLALIHRNSVVTILRDDREDIPHPRMWDFAGGGREGSEQPAETAIREAREELGLQLTEDRLLWSCREERDGSAAVWLFAAEITESELAAIHLGDEGQCWLLMPIARFLSDPSAIPGLKRRLRLYLAAHDQKRWPT